MISTILSVAAIIFSVVAVLFSAASKNIVAKRNARSVSLREIAILSAEVTDLSDAYASLLESHKKLRSRIGMRKVRSDRKAENGSGVPDPAQDPDGYKRAMRLKLFHKPN